MAPLTVRLLSRSRDVYLDLGGGNRIPKISERQARSVAELRSAGVGVSHALLVHDDTAGKQRPVQGGADDARSAGRADGGSGAAARRRCGRPTAAVARRATWVQQDVERARQLRREVAVVELPPGVIAEQLVRLAEEQGCEVVIVGLPSESSPQQGLPIDTDYLVRHASCWVCLVTSPMIPQDAEAESPPQTAVKINSYGVKPRRGESVTDPAIAARRARWPRGPGGRYRRGERDFSGRPDAVLRETAGLDAPFADQHVQPLGGDHLSRRVQN